MTPTATEEIPVSSTHGRLTVHLARLEAEAIYILREAATEFQRPTILYSIGKDSSVLLHLAIKAFKPSRMPFSLLHVDTTWKFQDMIAFRDATAERLGLNLIVHINEEGLKAGISPISSGSALHTHTMKTVALKQALDKYGIDAAIGGARRDEEKSRAKERVFSLRSVGHGWNPPSSVPTLEPVQHAARHRRDDAHISAFRLDRARCLGIHRGRKHPRVSAVFCRAEAGSRARRNLDHGR